MGKIILLTIGCLVLGIINGCKQKAEQFDEYVFAVQLVNDTVKIQEYLNYHKSVWPQVEEGFNKAGYHSIKIYRYDTYLTMVIKVPEGTDLEQIGKIKELNTEKVKAWNSIMDTYQKGFPGTTKGTKWAPMQKLYEFKNSK